jgi:RNA-directed DNA polymerase
MDILAITTKRKLANLMRCTPDFLEAMIRAEYNILDVKNPNPKNPDFDIDITKFYIPKKNSALGYRIVYKPETGNLQHCLKILNTAISAIYEPLDCVHGFIPKKGIRSNAFVHLAKKKILSLDISNFFETITQKQVADVLINLGVNANTAEWISHVTTINGHLVQGYSTSPTLANIVAGNLDTDMLAFLPDNVNYTRYADDLYFSSNVALPEVANLEKIIIQNGFLMNDTKTKLMLRGQTQYVTGLSVSDDQYPRIPKRIKRGLRLEAFFIDLYGYEEHVLKKLGYEKHQLSDEKIKARVDHEIDEKQKRIFGWLHFINAIEPAFSKDIEAKVKK